MNFFYPLVILLFFFQTCKSEEPARSIKFKGGLKQYSTLLQAVEDNCYGPFLLGSQKVQARVACYDKNYGKHNSFNPEKLVCQFDYLGLSGRLPQKRRGWLQQIWVDGKQATILYLGKYIYAMTSSNNIIYRIPYSRSYLVSEKNSLIESIHVDCGEGMKLEGVYETNDGNFIAQCLNVKKNSSEHNTRYLFKVTLDEELRATSKFLFKCVESTVNVCGVREHWSFKQYGNKVLISPYGGGRTGQAWWSEDYGNSFDCIFNIADNSTYVSTKPNGLGGYGAKGIHPLPGLMVPPQDEQFWDSVSSIGNGNRHIHSCCFDEVYDRIWLVMGDDKYQATGIYWSDDFGKTWHRKSLYFGNKYVDKGQATQMLQIASLEKCVLFGTDGWGNGIFRYNRCGKEEDPEIEYVYSWSSTPLNLEGVANHTIVTDDGIVLMVFAPNSKEFTPTGGVVASDGYHFKKVFVDTFNDNTLTGMKIGWTSLLCIHQDDLYIRTKAKDEIIVVEDFNVY